MTASAARRDPRREVLRALGSAALAVERGGAPLEVTLPPQEPGRTQASALLSEAVMRAHTPGEGPRLVFGAFVDGVQESRAIAWLGAVPVVVARLGAVVRARIDRRLVTWGGGPLLEWRVYVPLGALTGEQARLLVESGVMLTDTTEEPAPNEEPHPQHVLRRAVHAVQRNRESLERQLTERWCVAHASSGSRSDALAQHIGSIAARSDALAEQIESSAGRSDALAEQIESSAARSDALAEQIESSAARSDALAEQIESSAARSDALYIDGGLQASETILASDIVVGVIKSHHTLYVSGPSLATVMSLAAGERSSVLVVETRWRTPVASWYLRLRNPRGHEPLWGMVRVEVPLARLQRDGGPADGRADEISRGILAESTPLALPDARWAAMVYGVRDCEVFLRATLGT